MAALSEIMFAGKLNNEPHIVLLHAASARARRLISTNGAADRAAVDDYIAFFRVGKRADRLHHSHTAACAVPRVFVQMTAPKAVRAMVSRCVAQRFNGFAAVSADKSAVVFRKAFLFHYSSQKV